MPRLSMRARIFTGFGVVAVVLVVQVVVALNALARVRELRRERAEVLDPRVEVAEAVERAILYRAISFRSFLVSRAERQRQDYASAVATSRAEIQRLRSLSAGDPEAAALVREIDELFPAYESARDRMLEVVTGEGASRADTTEREVALSTARERLLQAVRAYGSAHAGRTRALVARIDAAEDDLRATLPASVALVIAVLLATAVLTHRGVRRPAAALVRATRALEGGDYAPARALAAASANGVDELATLAGAFGRMGETLQRREERLAAEGRVSAAVASSLDLAQVAEQAAAEVSRFCGAELAAVYVRGDGDRLVRIAGWAAGGAPATLAADGIVGQALATGCTVSVEPPPGAAPVVVGLGVTDAAPRAVAAVPLARDGACAGVLLLASLRPLAPDAPAFAERAAVQLAIAAGKATTHRRVEALAAELQEANASLLARNAELQQQGEALQAQSEELQSQSEELQAQTEELHAQADEIHRQNDELRASREALQRRTEALEGVDRRKVEFLAQLGHELRNPLAAIANAAHLLEARSAAGRPSRHVAIVSRQVRQLRRLVDDLLDVSRINHGKVELRVEPIELRRVVEGALDAARPALDAKGHDVEVAIPEDLLVRVDPARMQQVVSNLLHNAARYTPHGGAVVITGARGAGEIRLSVRDTGIGIAPELQPHLFEPFAQGDHGEKHGLGLGLALVQRFVRMHGGEVEVRSDGPGLGSEFIVRLPAALEERRPAATAPAPAERDAGPTPTGVAAVTAPLRILLVDDNEDLAETMGEMLRSFGYEVAVELEPEPALERAIANPPDVALLDIGLPRMDGYALARALRTALPDAPMLLIAATGYAQPEDRTRAIEAGFDLHLAKPVAPEELRVVLERAAAKRAGPPRAGAPDAAA